MLGLNTQTRGQKPTTNFNKIIIIIIKSLFLLMHFGALKRPRKSRKTGRPFCVFLGENTTREHKTVSEEKTVEEASGRMNLTEK